MKPKVYNIDQLRCNSFAAADKHLDVFRFEDFIQGSPQFTIPHRHNYYMLFLATDGTGSHLIDFQSYPISPGMVFLMHPGMVHAWESTNHLKGILVFFDADFFTRRYNDNSLLGFSFFNTPSSAPFITTDETEKPLLPFLFQQLLEEFSTNDCKVQSAIRSLINIILIHCERIYNVRPELPSPIDQQAKLLVTKYQRLVDLHYKTHRHVKEYADLLFLSPNYLNTVIKEITGKSAGMFIRERIMLEAKRMLAHDKRTVAEIGYTLNFKDTSYFCRFFKKYEGVSPDKFRRQLLKV